jgi:hypothetical protein
MPLQKFTKTKPKEKVVKPKPVRPPTLTINSRVVKKQVDERDASKKFEEFITEEKNRMKLLVSLRDLVKDDKAQIIINKFKNSSNLDSRIFGELLDLVPKSQRARKIFYQKFIDIMKIKQPDEYTFDDCTTTVLLLLLDNKKGEINELLESDKLEEIKSKTYDEFARELNVLFKNKVQSFSTEFAKKKEQAREAHFMIKSDEQFLIDEDSRIEMIERFIRHIDSNIDIDNFKQKFEKEIKKIIEFEFVDKDFIIFAELLLLLNDMSIQDMRLYLTLFLKALIEGRKHKKCYSVTCMLMVVSDVNVLNELYENNLMVKYGDIERLILAKTEIYKKRAIKTNKDNRSSRRSPSKQGDFSIKQQSDGTWLIKNTKLNDMEMEEFKGTKDKSGKNMWTLPSKTKNKKIDQLIKKEFTAYHEKEMMDKANKRIDDVRYKDKRSKRSVRYIDENTLKRTYTEEDLMSMSRVYIRQKLQKFFDESDAVLIENGLFKNTMTRNGKYKDYLSYAGQLLIFIDDSYLGKLAIQFKYKLSERFYELKNILSLTEREILEDIYSNPNLLDKDIINLNRTIRKQLNLFVKQAMFMVTKDPTLRTRMHDTDFKNIVYEEELNNLKLSYLDCENMSAIYSDNKQTDIIIYKEYILDGIDISRFMRDDLLGSPIGSKKFMKIVRSEPFNRNMYLDYIECIEQEYYEHMESYEEYRLSQEDPEYSKLWGNYTGKIYDKKPERPAELDIPSKIYSFNRASILVYFYSNYYKNPKTGNNFTASFINRILHEDNTRFGLVDTVRYVSPDSVVGIFEIELLKQVLQNGNNVNPFTGLPFDEKFVKDVLSSSITIDKLIYYKETRQNGSRIFLEFIDTFKVPFEAGNIKISDRNYNFSIDFVRFVTQSIFQNENDIIYYTIDSHFEEDGITYRPQKVYCFMLKTLLDNFSKKNFINPYTGVEFSVEFIKKIRLYDKDLFRKNIQKEKQLQIDQIAKKQYVDDGVKMLFSEFRQLESKALSTMSESKFEEYKRLVSRGSILDTIDRSFPKAVYRPSSPRFRQEIEPSPVYDPPSPVYAPPSPVYAQTSP